MFLVHNGQLDLQRRTGTFCDCVIRLHMHPDLFLAHKSVLAAFSPVFASLLPQHGSFMDLNFPLLTPQTLALLLDYMYTGTLPPKVHEEPVMYAAFHLQMEHLQHALTCRREEKELTHTVQDHTRRKRGFTEHEPLDKTLLSSSSSFTYGSDPPPLPPTPTYEVVPVICHLKTTGNNTLPLQTLCLDQTLHAEKVSEANKHRQSSKMSSHSKNDKTENWVNDIPSVGAEKDEQSNNPCKMGQFQFNDSQSIATTDNKDQWVHRAYTSSKYSSPEPDCRRSDNSCDSDVDIVQPLNHFESEKHVPGILSDTFSNNKSYSSTDNKSETTSQAFSQHFVNISTSLKREDSSYLENSCSTDTNVTSCEKRTSDINMWNKKGQYCAPKSEKGALREESPKTIHTDCCEFSSLRKDCVNAYHGHLRYHCLPESNDSDSDETYPGPHADVKDGAEVLETIDMAEIFLSTRERLKSGSHHLSKTHRFQCSVPDCQKAFSQRGSLNRHMRSHLGIRPYSCPLCTMTFSRQYRVTEHMRVHQRSCGDPS
ncbi:hypermethylated in cancer 2 protein-like isoform X2 [Hemibagrus wyckioides]|uniref:hypermethylated in cancer 2 protein-like isoform X2 n=1 Tax=Hemibagrus wyckioides TaxID=337641 RepID=UPI00266D9A37|nr:hypermethylated in cancer 2 protein-like isoform X2 [Hemibagrus wyckioides]